ncbi:MAG: hypothetical protein AAF085_02555 [Planctomycetota bacterium]
MSRTLHVIDQPGEIAEAAVLRLSVDAAQQATSDQATQHAWLLFGGEATRDAADEVGLSEQQFRLLPRPVGVHKLLPAALAVPRRLINTAHRVVCWTEGAAQIISLLGCSHVVRRVEHATLCPFAKGLIDQSEVLRDANNYDRESRRERWGVAEDTTVVALIGDRFDHVDASAAMMMIALTHEALNAVHPERADVRVLCHPLTHQRAEATEFSSLLSIDHHMIQDEAVARPWSVLNACDAALAPMPSDSGLAILWAEAMGLPFIAPSDPRLPMLDELQHRIPARSSKPSDLADALTNWVQSRVPVVSTPIAAG